MTTPGSRAFPRLGTLGAALGAAAILCACVVQPLPPPRYYAAPPRPAPVYEQPAYAQDDDPVASVYVDPPIDQPDPIAVQWAPPPMLVEVPPPQPYVDAVWTGGYWAWEGRWFWSAGRWAPPPRPRYVWVQPYYEHRADVVVFVPGFWCAPERHFVPPAPGLTISVAMAAPGVRHGHPPMGPQGVFVPPPPGSRAGIIVPAPIGTPPAVMVSAPAVVNVGMRVRGNGDVGGRSGANVTVEAPAGTTSNGQAFRNSVPARAQLAAAMVPAGRPAAPRPTSTQAIPTYVSGHPPMALPSGPPGRNDRGEPPNVGGRPLPQQAQGQLQQGQPHPGQDRPEFDQPPRQPAQIGGQPQQGQAQDPRNRGRGGNPAGQPAGQPSGQPAAQPGAQAAAQGQLRPAAKGKEAKESDERKKPERERKEDRDKKDGERDR